MYAASITLSFLYVVFISYSLPMLLITKPQKTTDFRIVLCFLKFLSVGTDRYKITVQPQIRSENSLTDQSLCCLPVLLHRLDALLIVQIEQCHFRKIAIILGDPFFTFSICFSAWLSFLIRFFPA